MNLMRRMVSGVAVLTALAVLTSCSPNGSGTISGPNDSLDRKEGKEGITKGPEGMSFCDITPYNVFMGEASLPFSLHCETPTHEPDLEGGLGEPIHTIVYQGYNSNGCMVLVRGSVEYPSSGLKYSYTANRNRCVEAGATMTICGGHLAECQTYALPVATAIDVRQVREASK